MKTDSGLQTPDDYAQCAVDFSSGLTSYVSLQVLYYLTRPVSSPRIRANLDSSTESASMQRSSQRREFDTGRGAVPRQPAESGGPPARRERNASPDQSAADQANPSPSGPGDEGVAVGGVYVISVAARLLEMHPQTLRKYERVGLVVPTRSIGMLRLYSTEDIVRLRLIKHMVDNLGMNLAGVEFALNLLNRMMKLRERVKAMSRRGRPPEVN